MTTLRERLAQDVPLVAVALRDTESDSAVADACAGGMDIAELRIDRYRSFGPGEVLGTVRRFTGLAGVATLATVRASWEGGGWNHSEQERLALFETVLPQVDAVDIELSATEIRADVISRAQACGAVTVVSHHDFHATPPADRLHRLAAAAREVGADLVKIAATAGTPAELRRLARFMLDESTADLIVIAMGAGGLASRVFFPALGSRITYCHIGRASAPGQLDLAATVAALREYSPRYAARRVTSRG